MNVITHLIFRLGVNYAVLIWNMSDGGKDFIFGKCILKQYRRSQIKPPFFGYMTSYNDVS